MAPARALRAGAGAIFFAARDFLGRRSALAGVRSAPDLPRGFRGARLEEQKESQLHFRILRCVGLVRMRIQILKT